MSRLLDIITLVTMLAVTALLIIGICLPHVTIEVWPNRTLFPELHCKVTLYLYDRQTECPHRPTTHYRTPRHEGLFGCMEAYDRYKTSLAFSVMSVIIFGLATFVQLARVFVSKIPAQVTYYPSLVTFVFLTIAWPLSWQQVTSRNCGRFLKDATNNLGYRAYHVGRGSGLDCVVASWAVCLLAVILQLMCIKKDAVAKMALTFVAKN